MKKFALAFLMLFGALSFQGNRADANGATVVFLPVLLQEYKIKVAISDKLFQSSKLFNIFESSSDDLYVARLNTNLYRWVSYYALQGNDVQLGFTGYQDVVFRYYPSVRAIIGVTETGEIFILYPDIEQQPV
ncbi:MAG: hypothetical protein EOP04_24200, partial [Proteobacteria bacterium]